MTDWITMLYERYVQLFGDPDAPVNHAPAVVTSADVRPTDKPV